MKKTALLMTMLLASAALGGTASGLPGLPGRAGGSTVDTAGFVTKNTDAGVFYVDLTGSNSNACTASGTSACATLSGALAKLPNRLDHAVTVNIAGNPDGGVATYSDTVTWYDVDLNAPFNITGPSLINATPATGSATGTLTAVSNGTTAAPALPPTLTDSAATWTTNNLVGMFVVMTSGAQNGVVRVIARNTATVLTLASPYATAPAVSDTFAIRIPGVVISNAVSNYTINMKFTGASGAGSIVGNGPTGTTTGIDFVNSSGSACAVASTSQTIAFTNVRCISTASTGTGMTQSSGTVRSNISVFQGGASGWSVTGTSSVASASVTSTVLMNHSLFYGTGTSGRGLLFSGASIPTITANGTYTVQSNGTSSSVGTFEHRVSVAQISPTTSVFTIIRCLQAGPSGILYGADLFPSVTGGIWFEHLYIDGCTTGINLSANNPYGFVGVTGTGMLVCNGATTCVNVAKGSRARLPTVNFTADAGSPNVAAIVIDGTTYTTADLTGASPTRLPTAASLTGSTVWQ